MIEIRRSEGFEAARRALRDARGARLLGATGAALQRMADAQGRLLRSRGQARLEASRSTMWSVAFTSAFAFMLLAVAIVVLVAIERRRARVLQELHDSRERLRVGAVEREDLLRRERTARAEAEAAAQTNAESLALLEHAERERAAATARRQAAHDIGAVAASHLDLDALLQAVMGRVREALAVDAVTVLLVDEARSGSVQRSGSTRSSASGSWSRSARASPGALRRAERRSWWTTSHVSRTRAGCCASGSPR